jgi:hypothetical protein
MTDRSFDDQLAAALRFDADRAVRPIDPVAIARNAASPRSRATVGWLETSRRAAGLWLAATLLVLLAGAVLVASWGGHPGPHASPPPTPETSIATSAARSSAAQQVPADLQGLWVGPSGRLPDPPLAAGAGTTLRLAAAGLTIGQVDPSNNDPAGSPLMRASASIVDGRLSVVSRTPAAFSCSPADVGTYAYALSPSGQTLTISDGQDPCELRRSGLVGTWWLSDCKISNDACLGLVDAGALSSQNFRPDLPVGGTWRPKFGDLTLTVPDGWAAGPDWEFEFVLMQGDVYASAYGPSEASFDPLPSVTFLGQVQPESLSSACSAVVDPAIPDSAQGMIAWIRTSNRLLSTPSTPMTVGGRRALYTDVSLGPKTTATCADHRFDYLIFGNLQGTIGGQSTLATGVLPATSQRLILVDMGSGAVVAIIVEATPAELNPFFQSVGPILGSVRVP